MDIREVRWENMDWIYLAQDKNRNLRVAQYARNFPTSREPAGFSYMPLVHQQVISNKSGRE
jgi:hypothetical protein